MDNIQKFNKNIAELLKQKRKALKITQAEIAAQLGIEQATYSGWESGKREISLARYVQLAEILGLDTPYQVGNMTTPNINSETIEKIKQEIKQEVLAELKTTIWQELIQKLS